MAAAGGIDERVGLDDAGDAHLLPHRVCRSLTAWLLFTMVRLALDLPDAGLRDEAAIRRACPIR